MSALIGDATNADLSLVTVMFGVANHAEEIGGIWQKAKSDLRNRINATRRENARWNRVSFTCWVEADPIIFDDMAILGSEQRTMLAGLNTPRWRDDGGPAWVVHMHGIAHHRSIDWQEVQSGLALQWPSERQVHVSPFFGDRSPEENVRGVIRYATKYRAGRTIGGGQDFWPAPWMAEYYDWTERFSQGWQSMRFRMKMKSGECRELPSGSAKVIADELDEPLPSVFAFNSLPILYTDSIDYRRTW
jgi:hypothetical protein